ncbi:hypothetical protein K1T71_002328 [Dendrolimus kikuchii]|uniref:Uncharacterized protein n=1 Tax=Dendrolimus kikuchii TaxID=765133 RepID=A0ACC1DDC6_9NEOP|nr:hypothetical protein K1T71_002328 [Dendrolimus kikuchii]
MSKIVLNWGCCKGSETGAYVKCKLCSKTFHIECIVPRDAQGASLEPDWVCPLCKGAQRKARNLDNSPLPSYDRVNIENYSAKRSSKRQALSSPPETKDNNEPMTEEKVRDIISDVMEIHLERFLEKVNENVSRTISKEIKVVRDEISDLQDSVSFMSKQYDDILKDFKATKETVKDLRENNDKMQMMVNNLNAKVNQLEQESRNNNIEIQCVPENRSENINSIVIQLSKLIKCTVTEENILQCTRIAKFNKESTRPRSIVVKLSSPRIRDCFLASVIKFNKANPDSKLNTSHIGIAGERKPIFVTEHLSTYNKSLHAAARQKAKELNYKFIWVRNGQILMRKSESSKYVIIKNMEFLDKLE